MTLDCLVALEGSPVLVIDILEGQIAVTDKTNTKVVLLTAVNSFIHSKS